MSFFAYYMGPLRSVSSLTIWGPPPLRSVCLLTIWKICGSHYPTLPYMYTSACPGIAKGGRSQNILTICGPCVRGAELGCRGDVLRGK